MMTALVVCDPVADAESMPLDQIDVSDPRHRCVGARLAELQFAILREKILARDLKLEVMGNPRRVFSNFHRRYQLVAGADCSGAPLFPDHPMLRSVFAPVLIDGEI
jgi:hypothetical protein